MNDFLKGKLNQAQSQKKSSKKLLHALKDIQPKKLDGMFHDAHDEVFEEINCLDCANCCKTTSPIFRDVDIKRISQHLKMKSSRFVEQYLKVDADGDHVLQIAPCPFLGESNYCSIYDHRPLACREYPHTNRKNMHQILSLTHKNTLVCPAVHDMVCKIRKRLHP